MISSDRKLNFEKIFLKRESKTFSLLSKQFLIIVIIVTLTFLSIGTAIGSLDVLEKNMKDPFVNWISVEVPYSLKDSIMSIEKDLQNDSMKNKYNYQSVAGYYEFFLRVIDWESKEERQYLGRTIKVGSPIMEAISRGSNVFYGAGFCSEEDIGLIVTKSLLDSLHYPKNTPYLYFTFPTSVNQDCIVPIPIKSVVYELPGRASILSTAAFYSYRFLSAGSSPFDVCNCNQIEFYITESDESINNIYEFLKSYINTNLKHTDVYIGAPQKLPYDQKPYLDGIKMGIYFDEAELSPHELDKISNDITTELLSENYSIWRVYNYKTDTKPKSGLYDQLSIDFTKLSHVREFRKYLTDRRLKIDLARVESMENYTLISALSLFICITMIIFGTVVVSMFLTNLFENHLRSIKTNLGTLKAFGVGKSELVKIYMKLFKNLLFFALFISFIIACIIGYLGIMKIVMNAIAPISNNNLYFNLVNSWWTLVACSFIILLSFIRLRAKANQILEKSPGELIYDTEC